MGSKTKSRSNPKKQKRSGKQPQPPKREPISEIGSGIAIGILGIFIYLIIFWFTQSLAVIVLPLILSLYSALWVKDKTNAAIVGGSIGSIGTFIGAQWLHISAFPRFVQSLPDFAVRDIVSVLFSEIYVGIQGNFFAMTTGLSQRFLVSLFIGGATAGLAYLWRSKELREILSAERLGLIILATVCITFLFTSINVSGPFVQRIDEEPQNEQYAYDGVINLKAYYLMRQGTGYYEAKVLAAEGDSRLADMDAARNFYQTPIGTRPPTISYFWKYMAPSGKYLFYWSLLLSTVVLVMIYFGAKSAVGTKVAAMMPVILMPFFFMGTIWHNILLPTWWASLLGMISISFFVQKKYYPAAGFALLSAMTRETMLLLLVVGFLSGLLFRDRQVLLPFLVAGTIAAVFMFFHYQAAAEVITKRNLTGFIVGPRMSQLLGATAYLMFPYGWFKINILGFLLFFPGLVGTFFIKDRLAKAMLSMFLVGIFLWIMNGNVSSYWGLLFMPLVLISVASLLFQLPLYLQRKESTT